MKREPVSPAKAREIFERKLLAAEKQGTLCNLDKVRVNCGHGTPLGCWAALYERVFEAMNYGRRRGILVQPNPWVDRSWIPKEKKL